MNKIYIIQSMTTPMKSGSMYATNVITRDIRLQGDNVEKILVDYFKEIKSIKEKVSEISKEEIEGDLYEAFQITIGDVNNKISQIKQQADKIDLLVKTADNTSEVTITDRLINAVSSAIRITAENIDLNGYVSNRKVVDENGNETIIEGNWHIDEDGNAGFENLSVDKEFSCEKITINEITSPKYPEVLIGDIDLYVNANVGNDDSELKDEAVETITSYNEFLERVPYYYREEPKSKRDKQRFGDRFSYFNTDWRSIKFGNTNFVSYKIVTKYYEEKYYTMQDLIKNLPIDEMIEYLKDNGLNVCPIVR